MIWQLGVLPKVEGAAAPGHVRRAAAHVAYRGDARDSSSDCDGASASVSPSRHDRVINKQS